jgi:hypothetical protein
MVLYFEFNQHSPDAPPWYHGREGLSLVLWIKNWRGQSRIFAWELPWTRKTNLDKPGRYVLVGSIP